MPSAFLAELDVFLPSLPSNSIVVGDLNFDLNPYNRTDNNFNIIESVNGFGATKTSLLEHIFVKIRAETFVHVPLIRIFEQTIYPLLGVLLFQLKKILIIIRVP